MGFAKARGRIVRTSLRVAYLSLSICLLSGMHHEPLSAAKSAAGVLAPHLSGPGDDDDRLEAKRRLRENAQGTYIGEILAARDSSLSRWPDRPTRPLSVWIQRKTRVADFTPNYADRVRDAFLEWDCLALPMRFAFTTDSAHAEVHVTWIDHFDQPISGRTRWGRDDRWAITDANITLAMHHHQGELLDEDSMRAMAMHEIGHLLGLDHTADTTSIMAPRVRVRELSPVDRATVRLLYSVPPGSYVASR